MRFSSRSRHMANHRFIRKTAEKLRVDAGACHQPPYDLALKLVHPGIARICSWPWNTNNTLFLKQSRDKHAKTTLAEVERASRHKSCWQVHHYIEAMQFQPAPPKTHKLLQGWSNYISDKTNGCSNKPVSTQKLNTQNPSTNWHLNE